MDLTALRKLEYGVYIVSSVKEGMFNGQIANTVFQISSEPATLAISINRQNLTYEYIRDSKVFSVSVLCEEVPLTFIGKFGFKSGRAIDKFADTQFRPGITGAPIVTQACAAFLEAEVTAVLDVENYAVFIGKIVNAETLSDKTPLTYSNYHLIKKGLTPKTAPTYIKP